MDVLQHKKETKKTRPDSRLIRCYHGLHVAVTQEKYIYRAKSATKHFTKIC